MAADPWALARMTAHLETKRNDQPARKEIIRVSSAGDCSRKIGYRLLGFPAVAPTTNELVTFEIGHSYHRMLQGWLREMGWIENDSFLEVLLADPVARVQGSCDGITVRLNAQGEPDGQGTRRVIEIKSITNVAQERYGKSSEGAYTRLDKPRDYHLDQANIYAYLWNEMLGSVIGFAKRKGWSAEQVFDPVRDRVEHITMIYVGKDTHEMPLKIFTQAVSQKRIARLKEKFARVWARVDGEELPDRDHNPLSGFPPCSYCPFHALCISDGNL